MVTLIGVSKVGASILNVVVLLGKDFTKWILLANIIAIPVGYFIVSMILGLNQHFNFFLLLLRDQCGFTEMPFPFR